MKKCEGCMSSCDECPSLLEIDEDYDIFREDDVRAWGYAGDCD